MPAAPFAWFREQWFDSNGAPLSSGTLEFFESGASTTPLAVYSDADLTVSAGTTVTLNSAGFPTVSGSEVTLYPLPQAYRVVVKNSAGTTLRTADGIYALQAASSVNLDISTAVAGEALSAGDCCYLSDGSNSLTAGRWYRADADLYYASIHPELGFATAAIASGGTGTIRIGGVMTGLSGLTAGSTYYVSATAAGVTATAPMNARSVGVAISTTTIRIDFSPPWLANGTSMMCEGRLTLTSGLAVTVADVTAATTIYFTPYKEGNRIALFDGSKWKVYAFTEVSLALGTLTDDLPYDVFLYDNAGTLTLEFAAWTSATARHAAGIYATLLPAQNGVKVKSTNGTAIDNTRRYLGTFRTETTTTTEDSLAKRFVWNYYNRVPRPMRVLEATDTWAYTTATLRQANGSTANQIAVVVGVAEVEIVVDVKASASSDAAARHLVVAIGHNSTSAAATGSVMPYLESQVASRPIPLSAHLRTYPAVGYSYFAWLEYSTAAGTTTWQGDAGAPTIVQSGITGSIEG